MSNRAAPAQDEKVAPLKILYAGDAGSDHAAAFERFLGAHFAKVTIIDQLDLAKTDFGDADVLMIDGAALDPKSKETRIRAAAKDLTLQKLNIPTVLIGGIGGLVADDLKLKLGWRYG